MKNLSIQEPCSEKWNLMSPNEQGAFCQKCAKNVIDFTGKSNQEIKQTLLEFSQSKICGRISTQQMEELNHEFEVWQVSNKIHLQRSFVFSLLIVFGLTLFSCDTEKQKHDIVKIQEDAARIMNPTKEKKNPVLSENKTIETPKVVLCEEVVLGEIQMEQIQVQEQELPEIKHEDRYVMMGAMVCTDRYVNYIETSKTEATPLCDENGIQIPEKFIGKTFPNPAESSTTLEIAFPQDSPFTILLVDMKGILMQTVFDGDLKKGTHRFPVELNSMEPGSYLFLITSNQLRESVKFIKL